jgi:urease accessory protein
MGGHENATVRQHYRVGPACALEVWPAPLVLQAGAALDQETRLVVDATASLLWIEIIAPGRFRYGGGESFAFREWKSRFRLERDGKLLALERFRVRPGEGEPADWRARFPDGLYASLYALGPALGEELVEHLHAAAPEGCALGASPLEGGGVGVKLLARDAPALREGIAMARRLLRAALEWPVLSSLNRAQAYFG